MPFSPPCTTTSSPLSKSSSERLLASALGVASIAFASQHIGGGQARGATADDHDR
jgi:hypothetical protein